MTNKSLRVIFMGTPEFAVASLDAIVNSNHKVLATVTVSDKLVGRGLKMSESAVKKYSIENNIPVLQPEKLKNQDFLNQLKELNPDVIVVVAFRMLPKEIWSLPSKGTFNLHASLLPQYRGAAPINHAVINGEKESGVSTFFLDEQIDTGAIIFQEKVAIKESDNAGDLHDNLMNIGKDLVLRTLNEIARGNLFTKIQKIEGELKHAPKIFKKDCLINWNNPLIKIHNLIRGLSPYPVAYTYINIQNQKKSLKIFTGNFEINEHFLEPGSVIIENKILKIATKDGFYIPEIIQLEGKKRMNIADFINGLNVKEGISINFDNE